MACPNLKRIGFRTNTQIGREERYWGWGAAGVTSEFGKTGHRVTKGWAIGSEMGKWPEEGRDN